MNRIFSAMQVCIFRILCILCHFYVGVNFVICPSAVQQIIQLNYYFRFFRTQLRHIYFTVKGTTLVWLQRLLQYFHQLSK